MRCEAFLFPLLKYKKQNMIFERVLIPNSSFSKRRIKNLNIVFYIIISSHASFIFEVITLNSSVLSHALNLRAQIFNLVDKHLRRGEVRF